MKPLSMMGVLLIAAGIAALAIGRFSYTTEEKVLEIGPLVATADRKHTVHIPDIAGLAAIAAGIALAFVARRGR